MCLQWTIYRVGFEKRGHCTAVEFIMVASHMERKKQYDLQRCYIHHTYINALFSLIIILSTGHIYLSKTIATKSHIKTLCLRLSRWRWTPMSKQTLTLYIMNTRYQFCILYITSGSLKLSAFAFFLTFLLSACNCQLEMLQLVLVHFNSFIHSHW